MLPLKLPHKTTDDKTSGIYESNSKFFVLMFLFGSSTFRRNDEGKIEVNFLSLKGAYTIILLAITTFIGAVIAYTLTSNILTSNMLFNDIGIYGLMFSFPIVQLSTLVWHCESKNIADYLNRWDVFKRRYEMILGKPSPSLRVTKWIYSLLINGFLNLSLLGMFKTEIWQMYKKYKFDENMHRLFWNSGMYFAVPSAMRFFVWYLFNWVIQQYADALLEDIESMNWRYSHTGLQGRYKLWLNLRELCQQLGETLSYTYLGHLIFLFLLNIPLLYICIIGILGGDYLKLIIVLNPLIYITLMGEFAHRSVYKMGVTFERHLTELVLSGRALGAEEELIQFIEAVASHPPAINLAGYVNIDRGINVGVYSSAITYFIIILQFKATDLICSNPS